MRTTTLLRVASIITLLYCAGHTAGMPWTPAQGPEELAVLDAMKSHRFNAEGFMRTYWDFYFGFGVVITGYLLVQAVVLWQLGALAKSETVALRPIIASFCAAFLVNAIVGWKYFFAIPAIMAAAIAVSLAWAFIAAGQSRRQPSA